MSPPTHPRLLRRAPAVLAAAVLLLMVAATPSAQAQQQRQQPAAPAANSAKAASPPAGPVTTVAPLLSSVYSFWLEHGVDRVAGEWVAGWVLPMGRLWPSAAQQLQYFWAVLAREASLDAACPSPALPGGFHGTLDRQGNPIEPTSKTIVQQVRVGDWVCPQGGPSQTHAPCHPSLTPDNNTETQARHLWAFSTLLLSNPVARGLDAAAARKAADSAFNFIKQRMAKPAPGGGASRGGSKG
jgi:hypothetical protein